MSFAGFNEKGTRDVILQEVVNNSNHIGMFFIGLAMVYLSVRYVFPNDLFTSALFFDGLNLQQVFTTPAKAFSVGGLWEGLPDLTTEAFAFAASMALLQVFFGYKSATSKGGLLKPFVTLFQEKKLADTTKLGWFLAYIFVACFDTWTDTEYRSFYGQNGLYLKALLVSFLFYNLFSEYAIVQGSKLVLNYGFVLKNQFSKAFANKNGGAAQPLQNNQRKGQQQKQNKQRNNKKRQSQRNNNGNRPQHSAPLDRELEAALSDLENRPGVRRMN